MKKLVIDREKLINNIKIIYKLAKTEKIIGVLKGNGYGLDILEFAQVLADSGINFFAVSEFSEAITLREGGFEQEILLLSPTCDEQEVKMLVENDVTLSVADVASANALVNACKAIETTAKAHIKVDTGFGRFGFSTADTQGCIDVVKTMENVEVKGIYSHLSNSFGNQIDNEVQFNAFIVFIKKLEEADIDVGIRHICNSCGFLRFGHMHLDAVRIGSAFLGRVPISQDFGLVKIGFLESNVAYLNYLEKGANIGYANTYKTKGLTKTAVVGVGYKDGFGVAKMPDTFRFFDIMRYAFHDVMRLFKDNGNYILINGQRVKILGRISMYHVVVDITNISDVQIGDIAVLQCNPLMVDSSIEREYR